jgi:glycosyltransferase involved in cell wall biosynthesis
MTTSLRVCIITSSNIFENSIGGEGKYAIQLHNWLKRNNVNSDLLGNQLFTIRSYDSSKDYKQLNSSMKSPSQTRVLKFYPLYMAYRIVVSLLMSIKISQMHRRSPFSIIHSQDTGYSGLTAVTIGKILRIPVIISSHGVRHKTIQQSLDSKIKKIILKLEKKLDIFTIKMADEVVTDNDTIKKYLRDLVNRNYASIPVPLDLDAFRYSQTVRDFIRKEFGVDEKTKIIGYVGRFAPEKNLLSLLSAFGGAIRKHPEIRFVLVGTGPMEAEIKNQVIKMKLTEKVIFCGVRQDVNKILSGIDIFVLPSFVEGMSLAMLEAMATGCPIICSNISTNAEIISHKKEGFLVDPHNIDEIEGAILNLLEDDSLRDYLKYNAVLKANQFDINSIFPKILDLYQVSEKHYTRSIKRSI